MVEKIKGVRIPVGFKRWMARHYRRKLKGKITTKQIYAFIQWQLYHSWKAETIKKWVNKYKRR